MKLRKIITMGIAAIMAVSAMSVTALAEENKPLASFLAEDGVSRINITQDDIDSGNNLVVGYGGIVFEIEEVADSNTPLYQRATSYDFTINRTNVPTSYKSVEATTLSGSFNIAASATKYSSCLFQNGSSTNVLLTVHPGMDLDNNVDFSLYSKANNRCLVTVSPNSTTTLVTARNIENYTLYVTAVNGLDTNAVGTVDVSGSYTN